MDNLKTPPIVIAVLLVALIVSVALYVHAQAVYNRQIRQMQEQINYMHNHSGMFLAQTNTDKP
jgi:hypothetical protein